MVYPLRHQSNKSVQNAVFNYLNLNRHKFDEHGNFDPTPSELDYLPDLFNFPNRIAASWGRSPSAWIEQDAPAKEKAGSSCRGDCNGRSKSKQLAETCAEERAHCEILCATAEFDPDMPNIFGGAWRKCMMGCISQRCGGNPVG